MLASSLIRSFVFGRSEAVTTAYLTAYLEAYAPGKAIGDLVPVGPAPSRGHAVQMAKTLQEWAEGLDAAGIQVHQEGAIARFRGAADAPLFGRHPGAVAARGKTVGFYADVLSRAVASQRAHSFTIPATAHQGAVVAAHEALTAASAYHAAAGAVLAFGDTSARPELAAEVEKAKTTAGRAVAMHQTACAEAIGCAIVAESGPWFRQVATPDQVPVGPFVVGVEVPVGHPVLTRCHAGLDPQHGGGTFGLGAQPTATAACTAAAELVSGGLRLPASARYVTTRIDPDSLVAAMILSGRIPVEVLGIADVRERLDLLARMDSGAPIGSGFSWAPGRLVPQSVADCPVWGPLAAMCLQHVRSGLPLLPTLEAAALVTLLGSTRTSTLASATEAATRAWDAVRETADRFRVDGPIALGIDLPFSSGIWAAAYSRAPIGLLSATIPGRDGKPATRKFTVACARECGDAGGRFFAAFKRRIGELEPGWGGQGTIIGSPFAGTSLSLERVTATVFEAAREAGIPAAPMGVGPLISALR